MMEAVIKDGSKTPVIKGYFELSANFAILSADIVIQ